MELGYQEWATEFLQKRKRAPLFGRMGSGKTKILLDAVLGDSDYTGINQPILVLCGGNSIPTWKHEPQKWWGISPEDIAVARGSAELRHAIWSNASQYRIVITTYGALLRDHQRIINQQWFAILPDEAHKWRNKKSKTYKIMKGVARATDRFHPATGTPYRKGPQNIFTMLNLCYPKVFKSYWKFINSFCLISNTGYGNENLGPRNIPNLIKMLNRYAVDLPDEEVEKALPAGTRQPIEVEMTLRQQQLYYELRDEMLIEISESDRVIVAPTILAKITKLRQLLICPKLWDAEIDDYGAAIQVVADRLDEDSHAIIFTPFTAAIPYFEEYLRSKGYQSIGVLKGQISADEQERVIAQFEKDRGIIICSLLYGESFSLSTCSQAYFIGADWSFDVNEQAEGRIRRRNSIGDHVYWYYLKHLGTVEEELVIASMSQNYTNVHRIKRTATSMRKLLQG